MSQELTNAITDMRQVEALKLTAQLVNSGAEPIVILAACREAMGIIGKGFESGDGLHPGKEFGVQ